MFVKTLFASYFELTQDHIFVAARHLHLLICGQSAAALEKVSLRVPESDV